MVNSLSGNRRLCRAVLRAYHPVRSMREWYYILEDEQQGPVAEDALIRFVSEERLSPETMVWTEGLPDWTPASQVRDLLVSPSAPPPIPSAFPGVAMDPAAAHVPNVQFLYISNTRLIILSILSWGLYEIYWIYKNWRYLKERDRLDIRPFWRGWFGIFYCHSLLGTIHIDRELRATREPSFSPGALATAWIVLMIVANIVGRSTDSIISMASCFVPTFLCFVPVQSYINSVNRDVVPHAPYAKWSSGHVVCIVFGLLIWMLSLLVLIDEF